MLSPLKVVMSGEIEELHYGVVWFAGRRGSEDDTHVWILDYWFLHYVLIIIKEISSFFLCDSVPKDII
jgi:hypothetical protein